MGTSILHGNVTIPIALGSGLTNVPLRVPLAGLAPGTPCHYRLVATNSAGSSVGRDAIYQAPAILLRGTNPITNECHTRFQDPAAATAVTPLAIAASDYYNLAVKADGTVESWGSAPIVPQELSNVTAIAAGYIHALAIKADGSLVGWGDNAFGEKSIPPGLSNVVSVAAGWGDSWHWKWRELWSAGE